MIKNIIKENINILLSTYLEKYNITNIPQYDIEEPPKGIEADFALNTALIISKLVKKPPINIAKELKDIIEKNLHNIISKIEIAGPGFINIFISEDILYKLLSELSLKGENFGKQKPDKKENVLLEFVSANPTGPLHIGHGRGAAIGDSLARILSFLGYKVYKEYYLNDAGNQIDMLARSVELRYRELCGEKIDFPVDGYKGQYIIDIAHKIKQDKNLEVDNIDFKNYAVNEIIKIIQKDLQDFDVRFDSWFSENELYKKSISDKIEKSYVEHICDFLVSKGLAYEKDGALWFASTRFGDDKDRVLKRQDGRYTYLASDIAYHKNKLDRGFTLLINLWGADHHGYVPRMKAAIEALGASNKTLSIILYQLVSLIKSGKHVAMSTRAGEFITLREILDDVGKDASRFFFLLRACDSPLEFDIDLAKKQSKENPVYYVQYVYARSQSIFREAKQRGIKVDIKDKYLNLLTTSEERKLIIKLISFPDILSLCEKNLSPHYLTSYLIEIADLFHRFYEKHRVLSENTNLTIARLELIRATSYIIKNALSLLGVSAPERM